MRRRTAHVLTAAVLTAAVFTGPVVGAVAAAAGLAPGDFSPLEVAPRSAGPGATVTVNTAACGRGGRAEGDASTVGGGRFTLVPGDHGEAVAGRFRIAPHVHPGTYGIGATCADGTFATGDLVVTAHGPQGPVRAGAVGGTATGADPAKIAAGAALLAATAVGGTWFLRRRASGTRN
ncbi:hypothetical protein [Streptomyces sp. NPDC051567]|uniref:hypothetical protein n=1 Tax=Streptomyces sp. NPDC051567 TaxID=3365660 RepID=UPI0037BC093B